MILEKTGWKSEICDKGKSQRIWPVTIYKKRGLMLVVRTQAREK